MHDKRLAIFYEHINIRSYNIVLNNLISIVPSITFQTECGTNCAIWWYRI